MTDLKPEILSPAGSMESLIAAVRSGADAVYLGAADFSARRNAENFDSAALTDAISYCHLRGVKVYLALNTVVRQKEIEHALSTATHAYRSGVDGVIVQDLGIARVIRRALPGLPLHASTQMSIHSPAALPLLKEMGFCRVVVAREMSKKALANFCAKAKELDMEVEVFVHGALCMSVSGQCLLSAVLGARSGNRGLCAGPCRLPFAASGGTGYDLSLKDLSLFEHIDELAAMGVASLKIEGRMKRPEYVAAATAACRAAVDSGSIPNDLSAALHGVFSRSGFTDGYFSSNLGRNMFGTRTKDDVAESKETFALLHGLYRSERQSVAVEMLGEFRIGCPATLTVKCGQYTVTVDGPAPDVARSRSMTAEDIAASLKKLGGTPYYCKDIRIHADNNIFVVNSALNTMRREALQKLDELRSYIDDMECLPVDPVSYPARSNRAARIIARIDDITSLAAADGADMVVFPMEQDIHHGADTSRLIAEMPRWIDNEQAVIDRLMQLKNMGITTALCGNISAVALAKSCGMQVMGDVGLNIYNPISLQVAEDMGCGSTLLSAEVTLAEAKHMPTNIPLGLFAYGRLPLMLLKNCPLRNGRKCSDCDKKGYLTDRMGINFPVRCRMGYSQLLNSTPVFLADKPDQLACVDILYLYFTDEDADTIRNVVSAYRHGGEAPEDFTRGPAFRPSL